MIRRLLSSLARQSWLRKLAMSTPVLRDMAWRFVAGETLEKGLEVVRLLNAKGVLATMNLIGTHVRSRAEAVRAADAALASLERIHAEGLASHVSLKLTQIGLDIDPELCRRELHRLLAAAQARGIFVRIDMEESAYTDATLRLFEEARISFPECVGIVLQSYLRRNRGDLERLAATGASIRLVKGGYWESRAVAYRKKSEIDDAFLWDAEFLIRHGREVALATHDPVAIERAIAVAEQAGRDKGSFEFQMLFGVREDLMESLVQQGFRVRSYVPYGTQWYEYVLGCLRRDPFRSFRSRRASQDEGSRGEAPAHLSAGRRP